MPLYAIAGSQGCGKTTILNELEEMNFRVVQRKTARSILTELDKTLPEVYRDPELFKQFQNLVLERKYEDDLVAARSDEIWFTERTFADVFIYPLILMGYDNKNTNWVDNYYDKCKNYQSIYTKVFYLSRFFKERIEDDGVRSTNQHFSRVVDYMMGQFTLDFSGDRKKGISTENNNERIKIILEEVV